MSAIRALFAGLARVVTMPGVVLAAIVMMLLIAAPFAALVGNTLQDALSNQQPISRDAGEIDPEWWFEYRQHATGLMATFTPAIIGFAAPLDNLDALLDGRARPIAMAAPYLAALMAWSFLWGAALNRYAHGARDGFFAAGAATFTRFLIISAAAAALIVILYLTIHRLLFGVIAPVLEASASIERSAFLWRVVLYVVFGALLMTISMIVDYARVSIVLGGSAAVIDAWRAGARFVRTHAAAAVTLYLLTGALFVALLVAYGFVDVYGGSRVGGWRGIAIAQAYIVARLVIRLTFGASEVQLYRALASDQPAS